MAFSSTLLRTIESTLTRWLALRRPPENIREKLELSYTIENQDIYLNEIRPIWNNPTQNRTLAYAKIKYIKSSDEWKIYWKRGDLKWHLYEPAGNLKSLDNALDEITQDSHGCFFG